MWWHVVSGQMPERKILQKRVKVTKCLLHQQLNMDLVQGWDNRLSQDLNEESLNERLSAQRSILVFCCEAVTSGLALRDLLCWGGWPHSCKSSVSSSPNRLDLGLRSSCNPVNEYSTVYALMLAVLSHAEQCTTQQRAFCLSYSGCEA